MGKLKTSKVVLGNGTRIDAQALMSLSAVPFFARYDMKLKNIFTFENLYNAHEECRLGKQHKRGTIMFEMDAASAISKLVKELTAQKYKIGKYREFKICDPKERMIKALAYKDRVVLMCFCKKAIQPRLENQLIFDNAASRTNKGTLFAIKRLHKFMKALFINTGNNNAYFLKCDITKYFPSIDHEILMAQLCKCGFSPEELWFMTLVIKSHDENKGVPLGNQTSQWFALLYLNPIDRFIKEQLRAPYYVRYMDDFVLLHHNKEFLQRCKAAIEKACADKLKLKLNAKTRIGMIKNGVDFLGFNHKLTATGKVTKILRSSARIRQRQYLKAVSHCYLNDIVDDEYLAQRRAAFRAHLKGTKECKRITNKISTLRRRKRVLGSKDTLDL